MKNMIRPALRAAIVASTFALPMASVHAASLIACDGKVAVRGTEDGRKVDETRPAHDIYGYDDAARAFYKYSETRKSTDAEPVSLYSDKLIRWEHIPYLGSVSDPRWKGEYDRARQSLTLDYHEPGLEMSWSEQCRPDADVQTGQTATAPTDGKKS